MNLMIIGATGTIGSAVRQRVLADTDWQLTLFVRQLAKLGKIDTARETVIEKSVSDFSVSDLSGVDAVFVALSGDMPQLTEKIVDVLENSQTKRLVQILTMGIYNEVPEKYLHGGGMSDYVRHYAEAADIIESSSLDYTIVRPAWFDNGNDSIEITEKGQMMTGHDVSVTAISNFVVGSLKNQKLGSFGLNRPE